MALTFPKSVIFILLDEFAERFAFYGIRTILVLYMRSKLNYSDDLSTKIFHIFISFVYFFPLVGAIIADSWLGKFETIFFLSIIYALGSVIISFGAIPTLNIQVEAITILGMLLIAVGSGGITPCVAAFGGDQFKAREKAAELVKFFSIFYFTINAGSFFSILLTPIFREDVHCFEQTDCYSLAFGVPAILIITAIVIFAAGKPFYTINKPSGNMVVLVSKCIGNAIVRQFKERKTKRRSHWLEYAEPKYGSTLVRDVSILLKILILYVPLPLFWALFDQQSSRWTLQATRMNGRIGSVYIKPDQMQVINPLLILAFIPLFNYVIYPVLSKIGIKRPLQKLTIGGILAAVAFMISGCIELKLESLDPVTPKSDQAQFHLYNSMRCPYRFIISENILDVTLQPHSFQRSDILDIPDSFVYIQAIIASNTTAECPNLSRGLHISLNNYKYEVIGLSLQIQIEPDDFKIKEFVDSPKRSKLNHPIVRFISSKHITISLRSLNSDETIDITNLRRYTIKQGRWRVTYDYDFHSEIEVETGGVYSYVLGLIAGERNFTEHVVRPANSVHMLWQIPQYVVMAAAEVMFSVSGLEFSYSQAPVSMKSVLQACWLLTVAVGNLMVVFLTSLKIFDSQAIEFFLFAVLMIIDMGIFILLAMRYKYVEYDHGTEEGTPNKEELQTDPTNIPSEEEPYSPYSDNEDDTEEE
ncbi:peptide transporter family 1-like [Sergentomyia squamirostris]